MNQTSYKEYKTLKELYIDGGITTQEIGDRFGVAGQTIRKWLNVYGIPVRKDGRFQKGFRPVSAIDPPPKSELESLYGSGLSTNEIAKRYGVSGVTVGNWFRKYNIACRPFNNQAGWEPDPELLKRMYWQEWKTYEQIAAELGVDFTAVPYWFDKFGIKKRTVWETRRGADWVPPDTAAVCHLYEAEELGMDAIGKMYNVGRGCIEGILANNGVSLRRSGYPNVNRFVAMDGHNVKSSLEYQIDNWLYENGIEHEYEPRIGNTRYKADFLACQRYIEIWGITDNERYERKREKKMKEYVRLRLPLLSVYPRDFPHLDVLSVLLAK